MSERKTVLVVAPNPYIVTNIVNDLDWRVPANYIHAYTIPDAQKICSEKKPAAIIIDAAIMGENKTPLAEIIPVCEKPHCGIILLTSLATFADIQDSLKNVIEVFQKPYDNVSIANALKKHLNQS